MKKRKRSLLAAATAILILLSGCAGITDREPPLLDGSSRPLTLVIASDPHYLSPQMTDYGEGFMNLIERSDSKVTHYTPEIVQAFVAQVLRDPPDAVILSGDLTLNGDEESLREFAELCRPIEEAGIGLLVMPGNHDVDGVAYRFSGEDVTAEYGATTQEFAQIFESMGLRQAFSRDESSLSYAVKLTKDFWILMIDVNGYGVKGFIPEQTLLWAREQLAKAKKAKATVLGVSHQNLLLHNERFPFGYQIVGAEKLLELYKDYGVKLHFSGHMHMQHIMQADGVTDIASSSLAVAPNQYGLLEISPDRSMSYQTIPVDVAGWAAERGKRDENLLHFSDYAAAFFDKNTESIIQEMLDDDTIRQEEKEQMKRFALEVNRRYFAGSLTDFHQGGEGLALWKRYLPDARFTHYFENMIKESLREMDRWSSDE